MRNILKKLVHIQSALKCRKDKKASNYKYRSAEDIFENLKPILEGENCTIICEDDVEVINEETYYKSIITLYDVESEESISNHSYVKEGEAKFMSVGQYSGATISYCRKYALCGLFAIDDGQDLDSVEDKKENKKEEKSEKKQQFSDKNFADFEKVKETYQNGEEAVNAILTKYELTEPMKAKVLSLYEK